jgi:hypothetical protein
MRSNDEKMPRGTEKKVDANPKEFQNAIRESFLNNEFGGLCKSLKFLSTVLTPHLFISSTWYRKFPPQHTVPQVKSAQAYTISQLKQKLVKKMNSSGMCIHHDLLSPILAILQCCTNFSLLRLLSCDRPLRAAREGFVETHQ